MEDQSIFQGIVEAETPDGRLRFEDSGLGIWEVKRLESGEVFDSWRLVGKVQGPQNCRDPRALYEAAVESGVI